MITNSAKPREWGAWWKWGSLIVVPLVLLLIRVTMGLRPEHFAFGAVFIVLAWVGPRARRYTYLMLPFAAMALGYESLRLIMPYRGRIHVGDLYGAEQALFSVNTAAGRKLFVEILQTATHPALDVLCGTAYMLYVFEAVVIASFLFFRDQERMAAVAWGFLAVNVIGWVIWLLFPAAPPWYVAQYGLGPARLDAPSYAAGALRFDALFGIHYFQTFYGRSANVFGAMPSLHAAYPTVVAMATWKLGKAWRIGTIPFAVLMGFSAIYLGHHYILDVLAGLVCAVVAYFGSEFVRGWLAARNRQPGAESEVPAAPSQA